MTAYRMMSLTGLVALLAALAVGFSREPAVAQGDVTPLRVEEAVTGTLTAAQSTVVYSVQALESLRMAVVFDVIEGDMRPTVVVLDQDQSTVLAGSTGPNANGVVVKFPGQGTYYVGVTADSGASATYRLMIDADPALPINPFVSQTYMVAGAGTTCEENTPAAGFSTTEDLNVCFSVELIEDSIEFKVEWWTPSGEMRLDEGGALDSSFNGRLLLTGLIAGTDPWETGWWQVHFLIGGELTKIQWVPVR
jgi:hypothetical protein